MVMDALISIHAPAKGATILQSLFLLGVIDFNPRSREGSDTKRKERRYAKTISIHAPAKGATWYVQRTETIWTFQSTLPRRERQKTECKDYLHTHFNPRSREGSDDGK